MNPSQYNSKHLPGVKCLPDGARIFFESLGRDIVSLGRRRPHRPTVCPSGSLGGMALPVAVRRRWEFGSLQPRAHLSCRNQLDAASSARPLNGADKSLTFRDARC